MKTQQMTQAEYDSMLDVYGNWWFGPLPMEAVTEMLYRVKTFRVQADFTSPTLPAVSVDEFINMPTVADEETLFSDRPKGGDISLGPISESWVWATDPTAIYLQPFDEQNYGPGADTRGFQIVHITDAAWPNVFAVNSWFWLIEAGLLVASRNPVDPSTSGFDADFVLSCGTFPIPMGLFNYSDYTGTLVITATEWFPYKKHGGGDFFDTATGLLMP